jgi:hypothetical protein
MKYQYVCILYTMTFQVALTHVVYSIQLVVDCPDEPSCQAAATSIDDDEDTASRAGCLICMEEFAVGSAVSWSPREGGCQHVYHAACIREWLLRHMDCPYCRQMMFPFDNSARRQIKDRAKIRMYANERTRRFDATQCCQTHGLIVMENDETSSMTVRTSIHDEELGNEVGEAAEMCHDEELGNDVGAEEEMCVESPLSKDDVRHGEEEITFEPPVSHSGDDSEALVETDTEAPVEQENSLVANDEIEEVEEPTIC